MLGSPPAEGHLLTVAPVPPATAASRVLGLSTFDLGAITAFVKGDPGEIDKLVEDTRQLAESLAGPGGDGARARLLARTAATCRSQLRLLEGLLAQRVAARDFEAVAALNRVLDGVARRMVMAVKQLGVESSVRTRPNLIVRHADRVEYVEGRQ